MREKRRHNVCIIGNSHVASLKTGWDAIGSENDHIDIKFFASRGRRLEKIKAHEEILEPGSKRLRSDISYTSGGHEKIVLSDFDYCFLYSMGLIIKPYLECFASGLYYSESLNALVLASFFRDSTMLKVLQEIRKISQRRVWIGHTPLLADEAPVIKGKESREYDRYIQFVEFINCKLLFQNNLKLIPQPEDTFGPGYSTLNKFTSRSKRLDVGDKVSGKSHPEVDRRHMNSEFGKAYLIHLLANMGIKASY